jgi:hypothetical protein
MTNEERDIIGQFIARVSGAPTAAGGSVPATQPALPPVDRDADALIGQLMQKYPDARYRIAQLAFVQEHALTEAQNRIQRLQYEVQQSQQALQQAQQAAQAGGSSSGGGFFSGLFGGNRQQSAPPPGGAWNQGSQPQQGYAQPQPPPPQYAPNYQPGMFQRQGSGFLGSALTTAAGVAGGLVAGNALMGLFSGREGGLGGGGFGGASGGSPWSNPTQGAVDSGAAAGNQDYVDNGTWDQPTGGDAPLPDDSGGSWDSGGGGGWDSGGGGNSDDTF